MRCLIFSFVGALGLVSVASGAPDLVCSSINGSNSFGTDGNGLFAYSFGTVVCNIGDEALGWDPDTNEHPLISQSLYKLKDHQLTQIGIGFVRHTTIPLSGNACGACQPGGFLELGSGCSDSSSALVNGAQQLMGPRREVNAQSGDYPYPFTSINQTGDAVYKRMQVQSSEIDDPDALYFVEVQVISRFEDSAQTRNNNVSYRQVTFAAGSLNAALVGPTFDEQPALNAWRDHGNGIGVPDEGVMISWATLPDSEERVGVGSKAVVLGEDRWRLEYAVYNMNGDRGVRAVVVSEFGYHDLLGETSFHAPLYHDDLDEQTSDAPWQVTNTSALTWSTSRHLNDPDANAIRWGTTYSFSVEFGEFGGPVIDTIKLRPFGPGESSGGFNAIEVQAWKPNLICEVDFAGNPDGSPDGFLNFSDYAAFLAGYTFGDPRSDLVPDGYYNFFDLSAFIHAFQAGCP